MLNNPEHLIYGLFLDVFADVEVILRGTWNSVKTALCLFFFLFCFFYKLQTRLGVIDDMLMQLTQLTFNRVGLCIFYVFCIYTFKKKLKPWVRRIIAALCLGKFQNINFQI